MTLPRTVIAGFFDPESFRSSSGDAWMRDADPTAAEYNVAIVNYRGLTRSDRAQRLVQTN